MPQFEIKKQDIERSNNTQRVIIGILGLALPFLIWAIHGGILSSISHYYYTSASVLFIGILFSFGVLLISYKGYKKESHENLLTDNLITNIAGVGAIITVLIPTSCDTLCKENYLFGHNHNMYNIIHLISASTFIFCMGWMSLFQFTKGNQTKTLNKMFKHKLYKFCGYAVWFCLAYLAIVVFLLEKNFTGFDIYLFETIAVVAFGTSWLVKGHSIEATLDILKIKYES